MLEILKRLRLRRPLPSRRIFLTDLHLAYPYDLAHLDQLGFCPRTDIGPIRLDNPIDWTADPFGDENWCFQLHAWRMNAPVIKAWEETGDTRLLRRAFDVALDWHRFHERAEAKMSWKDVAVGLRAKQLAYFHDHRRVGSLSISREEGRRLARMILEHRAKLSDPSFLVMNNHGLFQGFGLKMLEIATRAECSIADGMIDRVLETQFTDEGVHKENSPDYHYLIARVLASFNQNGRLSSKTMSTLEKAVSHKEAFVFPDRTIARVGDTQGKAHPPRVKDSLCVTDFSKSGYVVVRKKNSMLFVTGMAQSHAHKHVDELSFQLFHNGQFVFIDGGKYGYARDEWRAYVVSANAHNTIALVGTPIPVKSVALSGSLLKQPDRCEDRVTIKGHVSRRGLFEHSREIVYDADRYLIIRDSMTSTTNREFVSTLLLAPDMKPRRVSAGFEIRLRTGQVLLAKTDAEFEFAEGATEPVLGWWSPSYGKIEPTVAVRAYRSGTRARLDWEIAFE